MAADGAGDAELMTTITGDVQQSGGTAMGYGGTRVFSAMDADPVRGVSFVRNNQGLSVNGRSVSAVDNDGNGYANGDYVYYISPHEDGSPDIPPQFAATVEHQGDFRFDSAPASCRIVVKTWGELTPLSYMIDWGVPDSDYTPTPIETNDPLYQFTYTYTRPGIYFPEATVRGSVRGIEMTITQVAAPVIVKANVPYAPTGLTVSQLGNDIQLNWDVIDPDDHDGFRVYYSMKRGDSRPILLGETAKTANAFQTNLDGMLQYVTANKPVFFKVTSYGEGVGVTAMEIESKFSNEFNWPVTDIQAPMLDFSNANDNEIHLTWTPIISTATYTVQGYRIYIGDEPGDANPELITGTDPLPSHANTFSYYPIDQDMQLYFFAVTSTNIGESARSNEKYWSRSGLPIANANGDPTSGAPPLTVSFNASGSFDADGVIVEYAWKFFIGDDYHDYTVGDGVASYEYEDPGVYSAVLRVTDDDGKYAFDRIVITANVPPVAVADASPTSGTAPFTVNFDASGSGDVGGIIAKYEWDFDGDGEFDWQSNVSGNLQYTYTNHGDYTTKLRVTDNDDAMNANTDTNTVSIHVNASPVAAAKASPTSGSMPLTVNLNATGSDDPDGSIVKWEWDWTNDGIYDWENTSSGFTSHKYTNHGDFTAKLRVTDNDGAVNTNTDTNMVSIQVNAPPVVHLIANPTEGGAPLTVDFNASGSYDDFGEIVKYEWDWDGNGEYDHDSGTDPTIEHMYNDAGIYSAAVRVTDDDDAWQTTSVEITVKEWHIETVDSEGNVGRSTSIALDSSGYPHVSYSDSTNYDLKYAYLDASGWHVETVDSDGSVGDYTSIAVDSSGYPHVSCFDDTNNDLKYAYMDDTGWHIETVDSGLGNWGGQTSIVLDSSGYVHMSYCGFGLKYAYRGASAWQVETVDSGGDLGEYTSITLDSEGYPHVSYYDAKFFDLKYAYKNSSGWRKETVDKVDIDCG